MLKCVEWDKINATERRCLIKRPVQNNQIQNHVAAIISEVRKDGDNALLAFARRWDGVPLSKLSLSTDTVSQSILPVDVLSALQTAIGTITCYHKAMMPKTQCVETAEGVSLSRVYRPIERVGLYVPGGNKTPLISSLLMQAIPARIAGCTTRVLCTPPNEYGTVDPALVVAAKLCGIETIYLIGGAQAIAAMAYGTASIPKVDKLFGPGNAYVTEAKLQVAFDPDGAAIDMPAGPSEVMILADEYANPMWVAADLLAQAEHGTDSQVILICESMQMALSVNEAIERQIGNLSRRDFLMQSLQYGSVIICKDIQEQLNIVNAYAPEHLIINRPDAASLVDFVKSAGTIFLGPWAAETMGDYVTGSNHVLPTYGFARKFSGLGVADFLKAISVQSVSEMGVRQLGAAAEKLAIAEGLDAHANAIRLRLNALEDISCLSVN
jgi:histidinol dehydrogenase